MKGLKQEIDDLVHKKVITAYFDNSEDRHGFLYLRIETVANFAGLQFKEDGDAFLYSPTDTEENWKPVTLDSLEMDFSHYFRWLFANFRERFLSS